MPSYFLLINQMIEGGYINIGGVMVEGVATYGKALPQMTKLGIDRLVSRKD